MKRFLLFEGDYYYPLGGAWDLVGAYDTLDEARAATKGGSYTWWNILDATTGEIFPEN